MAFGFGSNAAVLVCICALVVGGTGTGGGAYRTITALASQEAPIDMTAPSENVGDLLAVPAISAQGLGEGAGIIASPAGDSTSIRLTGLNEPLLSENGVCSAFSKAGECSISPFVKKHCVNQCKSRGTPATSTLASCSTVAESKLVGCSRKRDCKIEDVTAGVATCLTGCKTLFEATTAGSMTFATWIKENAEADYQKDKAAVSMASGSVQMTEDMAKVSKQVKELVLLGNKHKSGEPNPHLAKGIIILNQIDARIQSKMKIFKSARAQYLDAAAIINNTATQDFGKGIDSSRCKILGIGSEKGYVCTTGDASGNSTTCKGLVASSAAVSRGIPRPMAKQVSCKKGSGPLACDVQKVSLCAQKPCPQADDKGQVELAIHF